jgi:hypothetical protein
LARNNLSPEKRRENNKRATEIRWEQDPAGLARHVDQIVKRAPALTEDQRARHALLLSAPTSDTAA